LNLEADMARPPKELVDAICESLRERPEEWRTGDNATFSCGSLFIPNVRDIQKMGVSAGGAPYGGYSRLGFLAPWRWRVWLAARSCHKQRVLRREAERDEMRATVNHARLITTLRGAS